jgi:hypothetical protein
MSSTMEPLSDTRTDIILRDFHLSEVLEGNFAKPIVLEFVPLVSLCGYSDLADLYLCEQS